MTNQEIESSWVQTFITVTPEDNATIRTITNSTGLSGNANEILQLAVDNIANRQTVMTIKNDLAVLTELKRRTIFVDAECQTYLQGVIKVGIPVDYKNEATQTMYMGKHYPTTQIFKEIIANMNEKLIPVMTIGEIVQTIITFDREDSRDIIINQLQTDITEEKHNEPDLVVKTTEHEKLEMETRDFLNFVIERVFWISDSAITMNRIRKVKKKDADSQTLMKYNYGTRRIMIDDESQTGLTCEPKYSNTKLLTEYRETKEQIRGYLEDCLESGVCSLMIINDIIDEILNECAGWIHFPSKEEAIQTVAPCSGLVWAKNNEIMHKLKLSVVIDPLESSIIIVPLLGHVLKVVCNIMHEKACLVVKNIVDRLLNRAVFVGIKLEEIRREAQPKPMDALFTQRKRRLEESMRKRQTKNVSIQTGLAGVPDVVKLKESQREITCTVCARHSQCHACTVAIDGTNLPLKNSRILRTQDILLAYKPCYVVVNPSEHADSSNLVPSGRAKEEIRKMPSQLPSPPSMIECESNETIDVSSSSPERDALGEWSRVVDASLASVWLSRGRTNNESESNSVLGKKVTKSQSGLAMQSTRALCVLKNVFCVRESSKETQNIKLIVRDDQIEAKCVRRKNNDNGVERKYMREKRQYKHRACIEEDSTRLTSKLNEDAFKVIPIRILSDS